MNNSTPNTPILDDDSITEIEARSKTGHYPSLENVAALCATVRALRTKYDSLKSKVAWHRDGVGPDVPVLQERYDRLIVQRNDLQAQLEQVTNQMTPEQKQQRIQQLRANRDTAFAESKRFRFYDPPTWDDVDFLLSLDKSQEWQPIETAPKDGTEVLITNDISVLAGRRYDPPAGSGRWLDYWGHEWEPTHWMPLPAPPALEASANSEPDEPRAHILTELG